MKRILLTVLILSVPLLAKEKKSDPVNHSKMVCTEMGVSFQGGPAADSINEILKMGSEMSANAGFGNLAALSRAVFRCTTKNAICYSMGNGFSCVKK